jgi:hypothetical protein
MPVGPCAEDPASARGESPVLLPDTDIRNFAPVARIMKTALPENAKIAKEAKECMQECVSEFISFITSEGMRPPPPQSRAHLQSVKSVVVEMLVPALCRSLPHVERAQLQLVPMVPFYAARD